MRHRRARAITLALMSTSLLTACAGGPGGPGRPGGPPPGDRPAAPALFISPFGEPFVGEPGGPWPSEDWFLGADADLDGAVTFEEFAADGLRWFATLDTDRDGRLGPDELADYELGLRRFGGRGGGPVGPGGGRGDRPDGGPRGGDGPFGLVDVTSAGLAPQQAGGRPPGRGGSRGGIGSYGVVAESGYFNLPQPVKSADVNVDQRVSAEEWAAATRRWFLALDTDRDGKLTLATLPRTPAQAAAARRR
ncbi:hypothetical protein [Brevundimonas sp. FT23042]|uniref:hypothetical protein n=1 Tax=Brevundimonas sp. FT23042 TaxID=3393749 RepID=UPI003B5887A0